MTSKEIIARFAEVGSTNIAAIATNATYAQMQAVFVGYPNKYFTQAEFVKILQKSNPFINKQLHKLVENSVVSRSGSARKYSYKLATK